MSQISIPYVAFYPLEPQPESVAIQDLAEALKLPPELYVDADHHGRVEPIDRYDAGCTSDDEMIGVGRLAQLSIADVSQDEPADHKEQIYAKLTRSMHTDSSV